MNTQKHVELLATVADQAKTITSLANELIGLRGFYDRITALPDCNTCGGKNECAYVPEIGAETRINCPHWRKPKDGDIEVRPPKEGR